MQTIIDKFEKLHIEVVESYFNEEVVDYYHPGLYYMAKSIDLMGKVDAVYFTRDWATSRGCKIEREVAKAYGVKILEYDFIEEPVDILIRDIRLEKLNEDWDKSVKETVLKVNNPNTIPYFKNVDLEKIKERWDKHESI